MSNMEKVEGVRELKDEEIEHASGGGAIRSSLYAQAKAEGYWDTVPAKEYLTKDFTPYALCDCDHEYKWARRRTDWDGYAVYSDLKCFNCGAIWSCDFYELP